VNRKVCVIVSVVLPHKSSSMYAITLLYLCFLAIVLPYNAQFLVSCCYLQETESLSNNLSNRDREMPDGYLLFAIPFSASLGSPLAPANSTTSWTPIIINPDNTKCPNSCFRPVGLAFDSKGRLFMSSDATGEIYVITAADGGSVDAMTVLGNSSSSPTKKGSAVKTFGGSSVMWVSYFAILAVVLLMG
jgi:hypothetical protein